MQHFLLFAIVLTTIAYVSLFWASPQSDTDAPSSENDRVNTGTIAQQRESVEPSMSKRTETTNYSSGWLPMEPA